MNKEKQETEQQVAERQQADNRLLKAKAEALSALTDAAELVYKGGTPSAIIEFTLHFAFTIGVVCKSGVLNLEDEENAKGAFVRHAHHLKKFNDTLAPFVDSTLQELGIEQ